MLDGWLTDNYSWRWVFYINLPVCVICSFMIRAFVFDPPYLKRKPTGIDYWGIGLLTLAVGALQILLDKGQQEDWLSSNFIRVLLAISILVFLAWIINELLVRNPIVNLRVFRIRTYAAGVTLMTTVGFVLYGSLVLLPVFLQTLRGCPALQAGVAMAPRGLGSFIMMPIAGSIVQKFDPRKLLMIGIVGTAATLYELSRLNLNAGYWDIFWPQFFQGASMALRFVPLSTTTMDPIPREETGNATSLFNFMRNIGGSVGIAVATTVLARTQQVANARLRERITPYDPQASQWFDTLRRGFMGQGSSETSAVSQTYAALAGMVQRQAAMLSFIHVFELMAGIFLCVLPLLLLMKRPKRAAVAAAH